MKKIFTVIVASMAIAVINAQTKNLLKNGDFETEVTTFTVSSDGTTNELRRVSGHTRKTTETQNPTSAAITVEDGMWVRKGMNSGAIKTNIITNDKHSGTSSLTLINPTTSAWYHCFAQQRIDTGLDKTKKYRFRFWAKLDSQTSGEKQLVVRILDKTGTVLATKYPKFDQNSWIKYESGLIDFNGIAGDYSTIYFGIGLSGNGNHAGVMIDDIVLEEDPVTKIEDIKTKRYSCVPVSEGIVYTNLNKGDLIKIYNTTGKLISSAKAHAKNMFFPLDRGLYIVLTNDTAIKILIK